MMRVRVKICGLTRKGDVAMAVSAGADALGFVFAPGSPRRLTASDAAPLVRSIPPLVTGVGLFVNAPAAEVDETLRVTGLRTVQFHGEESPDYCARFRGKVTVIKAFRIRDRNSLEGLHAYADTTDGWLLDAYSPDSHGGTGQQFDWSLAEAVRKLSHPILVAGGLKPDNVGDAIQRFRPYAVDVSSGVESSPGQKDSARIAAFVSAVRSANFPTFDSPAMS